MILEKYLQLAFINTNEIKQTHKQRLAGRGESKLINNSMFLPTVYSIMRKFLVNLKEQSIIKKSSGSYNRNVPVFLLRRVYQTAYAMQSGQKQ